MNRATRARWLGLPVLALLALGATSPAWAQNYAFSVPSMRMECTILPDASVRIAYTIEFQNTIPASAIDIVDVGLPHEDYDLSTMTASVNGRRVSTIRKSEYIDIGVEVHLGASSIRAGDHGTFTFETVMPDLVFSDTTNEDLASFRITPTWFDAGLLRGTTDLEIAVYLPPGVDAEQVLHQGVEFAARAMDGEQAIVGWSFKSTRLDGPHLVGLSFPRSSMDRVVVITKWVLLEMWWAANPGWRVFAGVVVLAVFGVFFFRFSAKTGCSVFVVALAVAIWLFFKFPNFQLYSIPFWFALAGLMEWRLRRKKRKYLPPIAHVEGGGIKRGLTAPEAAVLLEMPLGRVLTLVFFGMLKKGLVRQVAADPLAVELAPQLDTGVRSDRLRGAAEIQAVIHSYEHEFLDAIAKNKGKALEDITFTKAMRELIEHVSDRMAAFDLDETRDYYKRIVKRAWTEASAFEVDARRTEAVDKNLEWMMMDRRWDDRFDDWWSGGYHYQPIWIRTGSSSVPDLGGGGGSGTGAGTGLGRSAPSFGDVTASFAGWTENVTGQMSSSLMGVTVGGGSPGGVINLSGVDKVSGDILSAMFSGGGGGGGGGGGCACAGCACACACAGGGR